jgi:oligopeptide transport system substrate-binding protein
MQKLFSFFVILLIGFGCQKSEAQQKELKVLHTTLFTDVCSFDPRLGTDMLAQGVVRMLHSGLAHLDQERKTRLDLAESYTVSSDYKTYTFVLRDCLWSDGSKIIASDFEESWKAALTPAYASTCSNLFYFIKNAKRANDKEVGLDQVGVKAIDDKTLVVELERPHPNFLGIIMNSVFSPVHKSARNFPIDEKNLISSGPFCLKSHLLHDKITLVKNPNYWDAASVHLDQIDYLIIKDPATALMMFEKGQIDWMGEPLTRISTEAIPDLKQKGLLCTLPASGTQWLFFNTAKVPFNNPNIRKALALSIDRGKIQRDILYEDNPSPALGLIPRILKKERWHAWFADNDVATAKAYFAQGMKELGLRLEDLEPISLHFPLNPTWTKVLLAIQQMWEQNLGIKVKCEGCDGQIFFSEVYAARHHIARFGWIMQYDDMASLMETFKFKNKRPNCTGWENEDYIKHSDAAYTANIEERWSHIEAAEKIFFDEMPAIPVVDILLTYVQQPYLKGVLINDLFQVDFHWADIETSAALKEERTKGPL